MEENSAAHPVLFPRYSSPLSALRYLFRTEKDATQWSRDKLNSLFTHLDIEESVLSVTITEMSKLEGLSPKLCSWSLSVLQEFL